MKAQLCIVEAAVQPDYEEEGWTGDTRFDRLDGSSDEGALVAQVDVRFTGVF